MTSGARQYRVCEVLGKGGFGTVYRAEFIGPGGFTKDVALKILNPDMEGVNEIAMRLRDEARLLGLLRHRSIVRVDSLVQLKGRWTIIMEYVEGVSLDHVVDNGPTPYGPVLEIIEEVAAALYVAYERKNAEGDPICLLHRDIKPANVSITAAGEVKVLDFGVARGEFKSREAKTRSLMFGSLPYMAPERLDFIDTHAGDVYSLGMVLVSMLTGVNPEKTSAHPDRHRVRLETMTAKMRRHDVPEDVIELAVRTLAYEPEERPSARQLQLEARALLRRNDAGESLMVWAERLVPRLMANRSRGSDELSGSLLMEREGAVAISIDEDALAADVGSAPHTLALGLVGAPENSETLVPEDALDRSAQFKNAEPSDVISRPWRKQSMVTWLFMGFTGSTFIVVALIMLFGGGLWWADSQGWFADAPADPVPVPVPVQPEPQPEVEPEPIPEAAPEPTAQPKPRPQPRPTTQPKPEPAPRPAVTPRPEPTAPSPVPAYDEHRGLPPGWSGSGSPAPTGMASVQVTGDAAAVRLVSGGKRIRPGEHEPGDYDVVARFGTSGDWVNAGKVSLDEGDVVTINCHASFQLCQVKQ